MYVKYGMINLMNILYNFGLHFEGGGVLGKHMFNTEVLKCHEDLIALETLCTTRKNNGKFYVKT